MTPWVLSGVEPASVFVPLELAFGRLSGVEPGRVDGAGAARREQVTR